VNFHENPDELCWCGSDINYRHCHFDRHKQSPPSFYELDQELRQAFKSKRCLHPSAEISLCKGGIIRAHTVQKNGSLSVISEAGHVMSFYVNPSLQELLQNNGIFNAKRVGINKASTFTGFCGFHDSHTFEPIERHIFDSTNAEQVFLYAYRATAREVFTKMSAITSLNFQRDIDKGKDIDAQRFLQGFLAARRTSLEKGMEMLMAQKSSFDRCLLSHDFSGIKYYVLELDRPPNIMCSFGCNPEYDFQANPLQNLPALARAGQKVDFITCSVVANGSRGAIIFAWLEENRSVCSRLVKSLDALSIERAPHAVVRFVLEFCENVFFAPVWWKALSDKQRERLTSIAMSDYPKSPTSLVDNEEHFVDWKITAIKTNSDGD